jgi:hypothetical protein
MLAPTRATALASTLGTYRGWFLFAYCAHCQALRMMPVARLIEQAGPGTLLRHVMPRLRCSRCGAPPRSAKLSDGGGPSARAVWVLGSA